MQSNQSQQSISENCFGNATGQAGVQTHVGGSSTQIRNSRTVIDGDNPTGVRTRSVQVDINQQMHLPVLSDVEAPKLRR